ncbi:MAG: hypothetical protein IJ150_06515 [Bacteroidales bacterium]|nr:hypothetical protein [Bacteroidales bacterium]
MIAELTAQRQIESFWNLIQFSDERVQKTLYILLSNKYGDSNRKKTVRTQQPTFMKLRGILKSTGSEQTDKELLDEYLEEKYGV